MKEQEVNVKQIEAVKRVLTAGAVRHRPGMAIRSGIKAGMKEWFDDNEPMNGWFDEDYGWIDVFENVK
jgi:hypothetical protein